MAKTADYNLGEFTFPRGWFAVAQSHEIGRRPFNVHYLGQDMILYRGESGRVVMLDAYCPHMGTHIGKSTGSATVQGETWMEGDNIRCPFHAWRFGADGVCNHIPYHDGPIPAGARLRSWTVQERYGIVFCWHDPEGQHPDIALPDYPEWDDPHWVRWEKLHYLDDVNHPVEVFDNLSDVAHLNHLHAGGGVLRYENELRGDFFMQREAQAMGANKHVSDGQRELMTGDGLHTMTSITGCAGPGISWAEFFEAKAKQIICITPIDDGTCRLWQATMVKSKTGTVDEDARAYGRFMNESMCGGLMKDVEIWKHKRPATQIMQLRSDGPFWQSRVWYSQFFNPRAKATEIAKRVEGIHTARGIPAFSEPTAAE